VIFRGGASHSKIRESFQIEKFLKKYGAEKVPLAILPYPGNIRARVRVGDRVRVRVRDKISVRARLRRTLDSKIRESFQIERFLKK
jgi:hypothetical protein